MPQFTALVHFSNGEEVFKHVATRDEGRGLTRRGLDLPCVSVCTRPGYGDQWKYMANFLYKPYFQKKPRTGSWIRKNGDEYYKFEMVSETAKHSGKRRLDDAFLGA